VTPKFISRPDPAAQWTGARKGHAFFAYAANYLIDTDHGVVVDVEATRAIRQAEVGAARAMLERTETRFGVKPDSLTADSAYGSAESLGLARRRRLCRTVCHYHPCHFRIKPANTIGAKDKIGRSKTCLLTNSTIAWSIFGRSGSIKSKMNCDGSSSRRSRTRQFARSGRNLLHGRLLLVSGKSTDAAPASTS
jgi:hypothetical protein